MAETDGLDLQSTSSCNFVIFDNKTCRGTVDNCQLTFCRQELYLSRIVQKNSQCSYILLKYRQFSNVITILTHINPQYVFDRKTLNLSSETFNHEYIFDMNVRRYFVLLY